VRHFFAPNLLSQAPSLAPEIQCSFFEKIFSRLLDFPIISLYYVIHSKMKQKDVEIGKDLIQGHINLIILCLLTEKDRYGYEIFKEVLARTGGAYELKEPSLYTAFRRLEAEKLISAYWGDESQGGAAEILPDHRPGESRLQTGATGMEHG
jgi:hypothetical protein